MSENQTNPGGEGRNEDQNFAAPTPPAAVPPPAQTPGGPAAPQEPGVPQAPSVPHTPGVSEGPQTAHAAQSPGAPGFDPALGWGRPGAAQTQPLPPVGQGYPAYSTSGGSYPPPHHGWSISGPHTAAQTTAGDRMPMRRGLVAGVAALAIALTAGGVGGFVGYAMHPDGSPLQVPASTGNGNAAPVIDRSSLATIAAALQPAIVDITSSAGEGSGVVISADGNIVTNNHVVEGASGNSVQVTFNSGKQVPATIVGTDPKTDLAVVKVDATGLTFAQWGDSNSVQVGDTVLAIGSPLGLQGSVTAGIVSALHRTITVGGDQRTQFDTGSRITIGDAIQTDAPINPGNSGGALVNMNGEVIGINSAIATQGSTGNIGVGFAISANKAKSVTDTLIKGEKVSHPYLGVQISNSDTGGARIESVESGSPAEKAGLKAGDVVTKVGDRPIKGAEDFIGAVQASTVGAELHLTIQRGGSEETVTATVGEQQ
jgi:putative serine protease PepD